MGLKSEYKAFDCNGDLIELTNEVRLQGLTERYEVTGICRDGKGIYISGFLGDDYFIESKEVELY